MGNNPFFTVIQSPQFSTRQEEQSPIDKPLVFLSGPIGFCEHWFESTFTPCLVQIIQPSIGSLFVIRAIDTPMIFNTKVLGKVEQQIITGHGATSKEIVTHPTLVEMVGEMLVRKDMNKELACWFEERMHLFEQIIVILHVFKHFDGHDQIIILHHGQGPLVVRYIALNEGV